MPRIFLAVFILSLGLMPSSSYAQPKNPKVLLHAGKVSLLKLPRLKGTRISAAQIRPFFLTSNYTQISPEDRHSMYPSQALSFIPSSKAPKKTAFHIDVSKYIRSPFRAISAEERMKWQKLREQLLSLSNQTPRPNANKIPLYLRHSVPEETLNYLQTRYRNLLEKIWEVRSYVVPKIVYASLPGEGTQINPQDTEHISAEVSDILYQIKLLLASLPDDPFLQMQQKYWGTVFEGFNPLLKGRIVKNEKLPRTDKRALVKKEFNLYNPDGTDYLLPRSETLIRDPDDEEELDSYAYVRMQQRNPPITQEAAALEREKLLDQIPAGLKIAFINDDALPRINFESWAKKGYLGRGATLKTFKEGSSFLKEIENGTDYDLVITDLLVPDGGLAMMPELRQMNPLITVIASSKYDRGEEDEETLFNAGIDGYLWYNTNLNSGAYGYIEYLRAMKNYYYYKNLYGWRR